MPEVIPAETDRISPSWAVNTLQLPHSQRSLALEKKSICCSGNVTKPS